MKKQLIFFIAFSILLVSCSLNFVPVKDDYIEISNKFAIIKQKDYDLAVRYKTWQKKPGNLNSYFTTFFIIFRNKTQHQIELNMDDFYLIDFQNEQYNLYSSQEVIEIIYPKDYYLEEIYPIIPRSPNEVLNIEEQFQNRDTSIKNIRFDSFEFNKLQPNAVKRGYIYFEKIEAEKNKKVELVYKEHSITFKIE